MNRDESMHHILERTEPWDIAIIGGGATGMGIALDAASRGYSVCLFEQYDFGKGTSSRSTKIVHGGVRYLEQGNIMLVMEGLKERGIMRRIAPHVVQDLEFIVPSYTWWDLFFFGIGLKVYDVLALWYGFGRSLILSKKETLRRIPTLSVGGLKGGILYHDGQFDDTRMLVTIARTATEQGAWLLNYAPVIRIHHTDEGIVDGLVFRDSETNEEHHIAARCVVNATGPFSDTTRALDNPHAEPMMAPSQGVHLILPKSLLPNGSAIMVPKTKDGRVMFAIPWHDRTILGTTETQIDSVPIEPRPLSSEIDFILETAAPYFSEPPTRSDVLSVFTGIRPLVGHIARNKKTASLSRDFSVHTESSHLITIAGGKWTIYRKMAEACVDHAIAVAHLSPSQSPTARLLLHGYTEHPDSDDMLSRYGSEAELLKELMEHDPSLGERLSDRLPIRAVQVVWAARYEMARTVEDVLSRRTRSLLMDAHAAIAIAPIVARLLATELLKDAAWQAAEVAAFTRVAHNYLESESVV